MRKFLLFFFLLFMALTTKAQIARWLIEPECDAIHMASGIDAIITEADKTKTLWDFNGNKLAVIEDELRDFKEGRAIVAIPRKAEIVCLLKEDGTKILVDNCSYACYYPYFSCSKLLVYDNENGYYKYLNLDGKEGSGKYLDDSYPFFNGYASCQVADKEKRNTILIDESEEVVVFFNEKGKEIKREDVSFISSVNDEDVAIVIVKEGIYTFNGKTRELAPFYAPDMEKSTKNHAKVNKMDMANGKFSITSSGDIWTFTAACGDKKEKVEVVFEFDNMLRPISYSVDGVKTHYMSKTEAEKNCSSPLTIHNELGLVGICWENGEELLPPQFDEVLQCFDNKAFVKLAGKYGLLEVDKDKHFDMKLNGGKEVVFTHKDYMAKLRVDLPTSVPAEKVFLDVDSEYGIELDRFSRKETTTREGNLVEYDCELSIPDSLADEAMDIVYPIQIIYDRLKSSWTNISVRENFYKKFDIEINDKSINNGTLTLDFDIKNNLQEVQAINLDVNVSAYTLVSDSVKTDTLNLTTERIQKISETHYRYEVYNLHEGINTVVVDVAEPDCPISSFSYDMEYRKPVAKTSTTPEAKENVKQTGSTKVVVKPRARFYPIVKPKPSLSPTIGDDRKKIRTDDL